MLGYGENLTPPLIGTFTGATASQGFDPEPGREFNISLWGTFVATILIERTFDNGTNWLPLTALGSSISFTAPATEIFSEPENGVRYRLRCSAFTSGTVNYRISQ